MCSKVWDHKSKVSKSESSEDSPSGGNSTYKGPAAWRSSAHLETASGVLGGGLEGQEMILRMSMQNVAGARSHMALVS